MAVDLEAQISQWRSWVMGRGAASGTDVSELEKHLRTHLADLKARALSDDEAFLVAVKRMASRDALTAEFARECSDRLWKQLVLAADPGATRGAGSRRDVVVALAFAIAAALAVELPRAFGVTFDEAGAVWYLRNVGLLVLPFLAGWFAWRRRLSSKALLVLAAPVAVGAVVVNTFPFKLNAQTLVLAAIHLVVVLWTVVGAAHAGTRWRSESARMDFVRFTGEWVIYYVLIALGGGVLTGLSIAVFSAIGVDVATSWVNWVIPVGAAGAVVVAALLVEAKQAVVENMAPVLTKVFTPLFAVLLVAFLGTMLWTRSLVSMEREALIIFDVLLVVVLGLVLYAMSARDPNAVPSAFDHLQLVLVGSALLTDLVALVAMLSRIAAWGPSPNKVAALGLNLILLVNLGWVAWLMAAFLRRRRSFAALEQFQMNYLPVYAIWAALVVAIFPPAFGFS